MKVGTKVGMATGVVLMMVGLSGCGTKQEAQGNEQGQTTSSSAVKPSNWGNTEKVVQTLKKYPAKFKMGESLSGQVYVITNSGEADSPSAGGYKTYGYTDEKNGIGTIAYSVNHKLNRDQANAIGMLFGYGKDQNGQLLEDLRGEFDPDNISRHFVLGDYATIDSVKVKEKDGRGVIEATFTAHFKVSYESPQKEHSRVYKAEIEPQNGKEKIFDSDVQEAFHADVMNQEMPADRAAVYQATK